VTGDCAGCSHASSRRDFLRDAAGAAAALFCALGATPADLAALPIRNARGSRTATSEVSYPLPTADGATIDRDNEVILVRWQSSVYAFALSCPHQRTMLKWLPREQRFQCPKHKSKYQPDGAFISGRATRGMDRYPLRLQSANVLVNTERTLKEDAEPTAWSAATLKL
jgi:Rieske Fe-S protein